MFQLIEKTFSTPNIKFDMNIEGLSIKEDGTLVLGGKAGPCREITNLFHEMGHLILCPADKLGMSSWGLDYKNWYNEPGYCFPIVNTCQDVLLELEVIGWQAVLENYYIKEINGALGNIKSLSFLSGWANYQLDKVENLTLQEKDKEKIKLGQDYIHKFISNHTYDEFIYKWWDKVKLIP